MGITAIIQARLESTRLPRKVLLPLAGKPLLQHIIESLKSRQNISAIVLAVSEKSNNYELKNLAHKTGIHFFEGSESNVLSRFYYAMQKHPAEYIMRVTGDNPFTSGPLASLAFNYALKDSADLASITGIPLGTAVEIIKADALTQCFEKADTAYQKEHVTPFIKEHPKDFLIKRYAAPLDNPFPGLRLTVDTPEDYRLAQILYDELYTGEPVELSEVIKFIEKNNELININSHITQRPMTHAEKQ